MSAINEYIPSEHEHGVNGEPKKFTIGPPPVDLSIVVPQLRRQATSRRDISPTAKVLFHHLTDQSFLMSVSPARGVVKMSFQKLATEGHMNCSKKTVQRAAVELEKAGLIWTDTRWDGGFEITYWYIRNLADPQREFWSGGNASFGNGARRRGKRPDPVRWSDGKFGDPATRKKSKSPKGQICPDGGDDAKTTERPIKSTVNGQPCPQPTDKNDHGPWSDVTTANGQPCPRSMDISDHGPWSDVTTANGQPCPRPVDKNDHGQGSEVTTSKDTQERLRDQERSSKRLKANRAKAAPGKKPTVDEGVFLELCRKVLGNDEMTRNGGLWRDFYRQSSKKAWAVMHETRTVRKERPESLKTTWAQFAMDLWKNRFA